MEAKLAHFLLPPSLGCSHACGEVHLDDLMVLGVGHLNFRFLTITASFCKFKGYWVLWLGFFHLLVSQYELEINISLILKKKKNGVISRDAALRWGSVERYKETQQ